MKSEGQKWLATEPQHSTTTLRQRGPSKPLDEGSKEWKALSTLRHQGFIKTAKRPKNLTKTYLRRRHRARKHMAKTFPYQAPDDY